MVVMQTRKIGFLKKLICLTSRASRRWWELCYFSSELSPINISYRGFDVGYFSNIWCMEKCDEPIEILQHEPKCSTKGVNRNRARTDASCNLFKAFFYIQTGTFLRKHFRPIKIPRILFETDLYETCRYIFLKKNS